MNKYQILKQSIMLSIVFCSIIFSISMASADNKYYYSVASAGDSGYYWYNTTGVPITGYTTNWSSCSSTTPQSGYRVTSVGSAASSCTNGALTRTTVGDMFLEIFPIAYTSNTQVKGVNATFYLGRPTSGTTTYRIDLGYVQTGVFTSFGYVTRALTSSTAYLATTNLNTISGTAPAGSNLALKLSVTTIKNGQTAKVNLGTDGGSPGSYSGRFYVNQTTLQLNIVAPIDITTVASGTYTTINLGTPTVTGGVPPYTTTNNSPSGGFPVGTTTVTWNTTDFIGVKASDSQLVTITPQPPPAKTYYWDRTTEVPIAAFTTNWSSCSTTPQIGYRVTSIGTAESSCVNGALSRTTVGDMYLEIFPTAYTSNTQVNGINATYYLGRPSRGTTTYRIDLGYVYTGVFTSFGYVTQSLTSSSNRLVTINTNTINGTVPAGSNLALKLSVTTLNSGQTAQVNLGKNGGSIGSNSGSFNVSEMVSSPSAPTYNVTISASPASSGITAGNYYLYNITINNTGNTNGPYTLSVTDTDSVNFNSSNPGIATMQINSGGSATTTLNVTAKSSATTGALDNTTVTVISVENPAYTNTTRVQTTVVSAPRYDVSISASPISSDINPGNSYLYNITVNNTGNTNGTYTLSVTDTDSVNFNSSNSGIATMQINSGGSATTTLNVTAKSSATTGALDNTTVTVISVENPAYTNSTQIQTTVVSAPMYDVRISALPISSDINPGNSYLYNITVNNTGNANGNYTLSLTDSDTVNFASSTLGITTMQINSGGSAMTTLNVTARESAIKGSIDITTVTVISVENPAYTNSTQVQTTDYVPTYDVSIFASPISTSITAGNYYLYNIIVDNTGNTNGNYTLSVTDSDTVNFTSSILGIATMQINSGGSAMTTVNVTARESAINGALDNTTVTVLSVENPAYINSTRVLTTVTELTQGPNCLACHAGAE